MYEFLVIGCDRKTGVDREEIIIAKTYNSAENKANQKGIMVQRIRPQNVPDDISDTQIIRTKVRGISKYQPSITKCYEGMKLTVLREPLNPVDPNAIALYCGSNIFGFAHHQLGYVAAEIAQELAPKMDHGGTVVATVSEITGNKIRGVNIVIEAPKYQIFRVAGYYQDGEYDILRIAARDPKHASKIASDLGLVDLLG